MCVFVCGGGGGSSEREIYFKEWAHMIMETDKSEIFKVGQQPGGPVDVAAEGQKLLETQVPSAFFS